jgi:hypothetical protein
MWCVTPIKRAPTASREALRAAGAGLSAAALLIAGIYVGSRRLKDFDTALVPYAAATVFAAFALGYRFAIWLGRPPTALYFRQSVALFFTRGKILSNTALLTRAVLDSVVAQRFIGARSRLRWAAHFCIMWGCVLAAAVTFPLSFGWIRFETPRDTQDEYEAFVFGIRVFRCPLDSPLATLMFNALVVSAALVLVGIFLSLYRRGRDRGVLAVQDVSSDLVPLILLFAISSTGVLLTASTHFMNGQNYTFLSQFHAVTVILTLLYIPFGKFFHLVQRPTQLGIHVYRQAAQSGEQAKCSRCNEPFASALQVNDLKRVEAELGVRYKLAGGGHYQDVCPPCRRKNLALVQDAMWRDARRGEGGES